MFAVDTNIVVRYLTRDEPRQASRAKQLVDNDDVYVTLTVLLETEWVLRRGYRMTGGQIIGALADFIGLPRVSVEEPEVAAKALDWAGRGMDFADALHLAQVEHCEAFVSFDRRLATVARRLGSVAVRAP